MNYHPAAPIKSLDPSGYRVLAPLTTGTNISHLRPFLTGYQSLASLLILLTHNDHYLVDQATSLEWMNRSE
jgi:hypothetical protein